MTAQSGKPRQPRVRLMFVLAIALIALLVMSRRRHHANPAAELAADAVVSNTGPGAGDSKPPFRAPATNTAPLAVNRLVTSDQDGSKIQAVLAKYSAPGAAWEIITDRSGRAFKMTGGNLLGLAKDQSREAAFLTDLQTVLGFEHPALLQRHEVSTGRMLIVDQAQSFSAVDAGTFPVFQGSIRLLSGLGGDVFLVQNQLRPVDEGSLDIHATLAPDAALAITKAYLEQKGAKVYQLLPAQPGATGPVIYADDLPNQLATQVFVDRDGQTHLLLIGHQTKSVVADFPYSLQ